jgi:hypothetical protein
MEEEGDSEDSKFEARFHKKKTKELGIFSMVKQTQIFRAPSYDHGLRNSDAILHPTQRRAV